MLFCPHNGKINGEKYLEQILKKTMVEDVLQRKGFNKPIQERKLFKSNSRMIFEQDHARPHSTLKCHAFMEKNFPAFTPTIGSKKDDDLYFPSKMDDIWPIERLWAILAQDVYREPRPQDIQTVMRRLREAVKNVKESTLTKLVHDLPAKMNEVYRVKGKKIPPSFDPNKSPFACKCKICEEARADGY